MSDRAGHLQPVADRVRRRGGLADDVAVYLRESLQRRVEPHNWNLRGIHLLRNPLTPYFLVALIANLTMAGLETTFPFLVKEVLDVGSSKVCCIIARLKPREGEALKRRTHSIEVIGFASTRSRGITSWRRPVKPPRCCANP